MAFLSFNLPYGITVRGRYLVADACACVCVCVCGGAMAYVFRELQEGQHEAGVLVSAEQRAVQEVAVGVAVAQGELGWKLLEVGGDVRPRLSLAPDSQTLAGAVDLF